LERRRARILAELVRVEEESRAMAVAARRSGLVSPVGLTRSRPKNDANLANSLVKLLTDRVLSVSEAAEEVQAAGYRTASPNFRTIVNAVLVGDERFKRVARGKYTASD